LMTGAPPTGQNPAVIYVMGAGRSGSTIFGVSLGNCENVFYAGELEAWLRRSGIPNFPGAERAQFWDEVRRNVDADDLFGDAAWRQLEYSLASLRINRRSARRRLQPRYRQIAERLYRGIGSAANVTHIVDTSHYPLRARELQQIASLDLYLVYLVRNPLSVAESFKRQDVTNPPKSILATNAYLSLTHFLSILVFLRQRRDRRLLVRYEDFIADPQAVTHNLLEWAGLPSQAPDFTALQTGLAFQGNRVLLSENIALTSATGPVASRSVGSCFTTLLQLPSALVLSLLQPSASTSKSRRSGAQR
jgi:hypothetical protein